MDKPIEALEQLIQICHASAAVSTRAVLPYLEAHYSNITRPAPQPAGDVAGLSIATRLLACIHNGTMHEYRQIAVGEAEDLARAHVTLATALREAEEEIKDRKEGQRSMTQRRHELEDEVDALRAQLDAVTRERDEALNRANNVERAELRLREEITDAFNRVGLAAGPRAIQSLVEQRDAAIARAEAAEAPAWRGKG